MSEVRRHQRRTASGKTTTVRHHTRDVDRGQSGSETERAREAWAERAAPHVSTLGGGEPSQANDDFWDDDPAPEGDFWSDDEGHTFKVNRAPAYEPQGDYDFAKPEPEPAPPVPKRAEPEPQPKFTGEIHKPPKRRLTRKQKKAAVRKYQAAKRALDRYHCDHETPKYLKLNKAVIEAEKDVPWWRRF